MPYVPEQDPIQPHTWQWTQVNQSFQHGRNAWEPIFNHDVNRLGIAAPNVARMVVLCEPKYGGSSDDIWWPTLIHRRVPYAGPMKPPSGLTGHLNDGRALLSWWGSVGATSYVVQRAPSARGSFTALATVDADQLLTCIDAPPSGTWSLYLDGVEVANADHMTLTPRQVGDQVTFLGRKWAHPSFNGRIQDFRVYAGALSAAEVAALAR
jgi:hypothetical protein